MTVGFYLLRFVRLIADLSAVIERRLDPVSLELKFINGTATRLAPMPRKPPTSMDFAVRHPGDIIAVFVSQPFADDIVALHAGEGVLELLARRLIRPLPLRLSFWDGEDYEFSDAPAVTVTLRTPRCARMMLTGNRLWDA